MLRSTGSCLLLVLALAASNLLLAAVDGAGCAQSGSLRPSRSHSCEDCCKAGQAYPTYTCSPPVSASTRAVMTLNDFGEGGDGGDPSECDGAFHNNTERVVALSTGWYSGSSRCRRNIRIRGNGGSVLAKVVDECDSANGCDREHAFHIPRAPPSAAGSYRRCQPRRPHPARRPDVHIPRVAHALASLRQRRRWPAVWALSREARRRLALGRWDMAAV